MNSLPEETVDAIIDEIILQGQQYDALLLLIRAADRPTVDELLYRCGVSQPSE